LKDDYQLIHTHIFAQVLHPLDLIRRATFGKISGEGLYNHLIRKKYFRTLNMFARLGHRLFSVSKNSVYDLIKKYLEQHKPDLVISVIPFVNSEILCVAQELAIPFIVIPPDLDATNFFLNIDQCTYKKIWVITAFNDASIKKIITAAHIPEDQIMVGGFPVRKSFFEQKDTRAIKKQYDIPEEKPVVFVLMGAAGSDVMYNFVQELNKVSFPLHVILVLGRNAQLRPKIEALLAQGTLTATIFGVTDHIADLMAVSDVLITKSGPGTICEAIYSNLPMLLDATSPVLKWELFNLTFVKNHGFGTSIESYADVAPLVEQFLRDVNKYVQMKERLMNFEKKNLEETLRQLLDEILK
jgi:UDP-N-acetylglucosamine:LPS N-acetylglucosamine transferase